MQILILAGKDVDEKMIVTLLGNSDFVLARYSSVSRGVRQLEKKQADVVLVIPDSDDATWSRAVARIHREFKLPVILVGQKGDSLEEAARKAGVYEYFEFGISCSDVQRSLGYLESRLAVEARGARQQEKLDWIEKAGRLGNWEMRKDGQVLWSDGFRRIVETSDQRLSEDFGSLRQFVHPDDLEIFDEANKATFEDGWPLDFEYRLIGDGDKVRHLHLHRRVELGSGGEVIRAYGMAQDITPHKEFEQFLFRRDAILQVVGTFAGHFLRESDWESSVGNTLARLGKAADVTRAFIFGKSSDQENDMDMSMKYEWASPSIEPIIDRPEVHNRSFAKMYSKWKEALTKRRVIAGHVRNFQTSEREFLGFVDARSIMFIPVFVGTEWWGFMGFSEHREDREWSPVEIESMTMVADMFGSAILRRRMEDLLVEANRSAQKANRSAQEASQAKSHFLANMSHEIRTPISGILGMAEMTITMGLSPEQREHMDMIRDAARSLLGIVNDVLDISKIEARKMELDPEDFELRGMVETLVRPFAAQAEQKGVVFQSRVSNDVPQCINGDPDRLGQILRNLLGNALKFTERGLIELTVGVAKKTQSQVCLLFTVRDTGEGIAKDKLESIFESFTQADSSVHKKHQGTGLGLTISKELVRMMDGNIRVDSDSGQGSSFSFTAWFGRAESFESGDKNISTAVPQTLQLTILLAEDNPLNQKFLTHFLSMFGHTVILAENGLEVLEKLKEKETHVDIILMDVQMPKMGGIEATQVIRESDGRLYDRNVPIIALTAYAMKGDKERMLDAGMDGYVSKPIDMKELSASIVQCMEDKQSPSVELSSSFRKPSAPEPGIDSAILDIEALVERFEGDTSLLKDILDLFLLEAEEKLKKLDIGVETGSADDLGMALHSITNIASHVLAMDIVTTTRRLEKLCYLGRTDEVFVGIQKIRPRFVELVNAVKEYAQTL